MHKSTILLILVLFVSHINNAQSPTLVQDYIGGPDGSIDGRIYNFQNKLTYEGFTELGEPVILQYDNNTDQISVLATSQDFDGEISSIASNTLEMVVFTRNGDVGSPNKNLYRAYENDFSDIIKLYNSGDADLLTFRFHQDHYMILERYQDLGEDRVNFKIVSSDGTVDDFLIGLEGSSGDFRFTAVDGHFIVMPEVDYIDGKSVLVYSIEEKTEVPITNLIPDFQDCGILSRITTLNDNLIYYDCDKVYLYELNSNQYIDAPTDFFSIIYDKPDYAFIYYTGSLYKLIKSTGELEPVQHDVYYYRPFFSTIVMTTPFGSNLNISLYNFETEELFTYPTDIPTDLSVRLTGFGIVPEGVHFVMYESFEDNGVISSINKNSYTVIDSVYNINFNNRPVAYDEDIYFTHQDPEVGNELFVIDYEVSSLNELAKKELISVFPNPVIDYLQINHKSDSKLNTIQIIDQDGRIIKTEATQSILNVSQLNSGLYFLKVIYEDGEIWVSRFVKN
jgi:hypothetical protein